MSFFGGGTDYKPFFDEFGGSVLSTTIDKHVYVTLRRCPPFFDYHTQIRYSKTENVRKTEEIEHPLVRNCMMYTGLHNLSIYIERELCNESGGWQDQIAVAYGGFNRIDFNSDGFEVTPIIISRQRKDILNSHLMLYFTGLSRFGSEVAKTQEKATKEKIQELKEMLTLVNEAEKVLLSNSSITEFGKLLDHTWKLKRRLTGGISTDYIDDIYEKAKDNGAIGGKLMGAGGGGFMILFAEPEVQPKIRKALSHLVHVPFVFGNEGSKIFYYTAEDLDN